MTASMTIGQHPNELEKGKSYCSNKEIPLMHNAPPSVKPSKDLQEALTRLHKTILSPRTPFIILERHTDIADKLWYEISARNMIGWLNPSALFGGLTVTVDNGRSQ